MAICAVRFGAEGRPSTFWAVWRITAVQPATHHRRSRRFLRAPNAVIRFLSGCFGNLFAQTTAACSNGASAPVGGQHRTPLKGVIAYKRMPTLGVLFSEAPDVTALKTLV